MQARYLHGLAVDMLLARTSAAGTTAWYLTDWQGSVRDIANTSGTVIDHVVYDGFGRVVSETSPANGDRGTCWPVQVHWLGFDVPDRFVIVSGLPFRQLMVDRQGRRPGEGPGRW